jgi:hypothetical protein
LLALRPTVLAVASCTRQHANLFVSGQIISGLVNSLLLLFSLQEHQAHAAISCMLLLGLRVCS